MKSFRDWIVFAAGFEAFHTISHIVIALSINLPLVTKYGTMTSTMNTWAIVINAMITIGLVWLAKRLA